MCLRRGRSDDPLMNVFEAELPTLAYEHLDDPEEAHELIAQARSKAPIAMGAHGPEFLNSWSACCCASAVPGAAGHVPCAGPRRTRPGRRGIGTCRPDRLDGPSGTTGCANWYAKPSPPGPPHGCTRRSPTSSPNGRAARSARALRHRQRHRPPVPIPIICALLGAPKDDWNLFSDWTDDIFKVFSWASPAKKTASCPRGMS